MTNDYKERVIKWLTNNYEVGQSSTTPLFQTLNSTTTTINDYVDAVQGYIQGRDGKGNPLDIGFIYGEKNNKGVILVVNNNFDILQVIDSYDTGTTFNQFVCLNIDITNGNIYGVDLQGSQYRFILLNNFLVKLGTQQDYEVKLRNSYLLNFTNNTFEPYYVEKRPSDSFYVITGIANSKPATATYSIEVGSTNELLEYVWSGSYTGYLDLKAYNIQWSGEEFTEKIGCLNYVQQSADLHDINYMEFTFDNSTITRNANIVVGDSASNIHMVSVYSGVEITNNNTYINYNLNGESDTKLVKVDYNNSTVIDYYRITGEIGLDYTWTRIKMLKMNNTVYFYGYENIDSPNDNTQTEIRLYFGLIAEASGTPYIIVEDFNGGKLYDIVVYVGQDIFYVTNTYNLYNYHLMGARSTDLLSVKQIFNSLNYNFEDYEALNSLVPTSVWLYSDNELVFARNLYNKTINGNTTLSSVEVPNMLLNDISITPQHLLGGTNGILVENSEAITKNVYEDLFINFLNTLTIQDRNTLDYKTNIPGSTRLNNSVSNDRDYIDATISKIQYNYYDGSNNIIQIPSATRISQFVYQFDFNLYIPKLTTSIDLLSGDGSTVYLTIDTSNLEIGKFYNIKQNVEIGE